MAVNWHETESLFLLIVDKKGKVRHICFLVLALKLVTIAIKLSRLLLLLTMGVSLFIDKRRLLLLW